VKMEKYKYRALRLQAQNFIISNSQLYWKDPIGILFLCLVEIEAQRVIDDFHSGICGGHYS